LKQVIFAVHSSRKRKVPRLRMIFASLRSCCARDDSSSERFGKTDLTVLMLSRSVTSATGTKPNLWKTFVNRQNLLERANHQQNNPNIKFQNMAQSPPSTCYSGYSNQKISRARPKAALFVFWGPLCQKNFSSMKPATRPNLPIGSEGILPNWLSWAKPQAWDCQSLNRATRVSAMILLPASKKFVGAFRSNPLLPRPC
jgi:hypothetical protein